MELVLTSDWHGELPDCGSGDVLIVAGDVMPVWDHHLGYQADWYQRALLPHLAKQHFRQVCWVAGNHDFWLEKNDPDELANMQWVNYLQDEPFEYKGLKFYGTPWSPRFGRWAFMTDESTLSYIWAAIPTNTDVLIVHGPPHGAGDRTERENLEVGSPSLRRWIEENQPRVVVTGHIHEGYGSYQIGATTVYNVSLMNLQYDPVNKPVKITLDLPAVTGENNGL